MTVSRDELVKSLVRAGEQLVTGDDEAELDAYFAPNYASIRSVDGRH